MSVEEAANFVAMQATIGSSRSGLTKAALSNPALGAMIGGGLGAGAGLLSSWGDDEEKRKNWLSNTLTGGLMGAGVGGAAGLGWDMSKTVGDGGDPIQKRKNELLKLIEDRRTAQNQKPIADPVGDGIRNNMPSLNSPLLTPEELTEWKGMGGNADEIGGLNIADTASTAKEYLGRPGTLAASGAGGTAMGHLYDRAARGSFDGNRVMNLTPEQIKALPGGVGPVVTRMQGDMSAAQGLDGKMTAPSLRERLMTRLSGKSPVPGYQIPTGAPAPAPSRMQKLLGITPKAPIGASTPLTTQPQWNAMRGPVMKNVPTGRIGKMVGGGLGALATPLVSSALSRMLQTDQQPQQSFVTPPRR